MHAGELPKRNGYAGRKSERPPPSWSRRKQLGQCFARPAAGTVRNFSQDLRTGPKLRNHNRTAKVSLLLRPSSFVTIGISCKQALQGESIAILASIDSRIQATLAA